MGNVDPTDTRTPEDFSIRARLRCLWWCGKAEHEWFSAVPSDFLYSFRCPFCMAELSAEHQRIRKLPVAQVPELVAAWRDPRPYENLVVDDLDTGVVGKNFGRTYSLRCPAGHKIDTVVSSFLFVGCPWCRGNETRSAPKMPLAEADPELAATFHPTRNGNLDPANTPENYQKPLWWKSVQCCGHEWQETISGRVVGRRPQAGIGALRL